MTRGQEYNHALPGVSVIIPTVGRPELIRALDSVSRQDYRGTIETIVVVDRPSSCVDESLLEPADIVLYTGGGRRAGAARNQGIARATQPYVAFLDDDDEWTPWKLSAQIPAFEATGADIIGTRAVYRNADTGTTSPPVPERVKSAEETYAEYLFRKRSPKIGRPVIFGVTLVVSTPLAQRIPWDESLRKHQDWDWVDRMEEDGAVIVQIPDASAIVWTGSKGSITSTPDWRVSLTWAESRATAWRPEVLADFLAGQALRYAIQARSVRGVLATVSSIIRTRRRPSAQCLALGIAGLVPRQLINRLLTRRRRKA